MTTRVCVDCGIEKSLDEFHRDPHSALGRAYVCAPCKRARQRKYAELNPEKIRQKTRRQELRRYGLTLAEYDAMLELQQGACAICRERFSSTPNVDHCHSTGDVRGLLCRGCNQGLGNFRDNQEFLAQAIKYLS